MTDVAIDAKVIAEGPRVSWEDSGRTLFMS